MKRQDSNTTNTKGQTMKEAAAAARSAQQSKRDTVMISHANPEDNEFTLWLALQLAKDGYRVWSDVTKLLGGEQFWADIEEVIRKNAVKVVYVLSKTSNESSRGFRKELHLADSVGRQAGIRNFIIPVAIDDLPPRDYNVYVQQLNSLPFQNWASGLKKLLQLLKRDRVPKSKHQYNPSAVGLWWRNFRSAKAGITRRPDQYFSNWFKIESIPSGLFWHTLEGDTDEKITLDIDLPFRFIQRDSQILTFADEEEVNKAIAPHLRVVASEWLAVDDFSAGTQTLPGVEGRIVKNLFTQLLRECWERWIENRGVGIYELSGNARCAFFMGNEGADNLKVTFTAVDGKQTWRSLIGTWTRIPKGDSNAPATPIKKYWHFAIQGRPRLWPWLLFHVSSHVIFSDNGRTPWESHRRMHKARRSRCKSWYNDEWRDRLIAAMCHLAEPDGKLRIPLSSSEEMLVVTQPVVFDSKITCERLPTSLIKPSKEAELDDEDFDDDDEENF